MKGTNETEVLLVRINRLFGLFIQNREIYLKNVGQKVSALEPDVRKYITSDIPEVLRLFVDWEDKGVCWGRAVNQNSLDCCSG